MRTTIFLCSSLVTLTVMLQVNSARANCARPVDYKTTVTGNRVTIQPVNFGRRKCPDPGGMLRQAVGSNEIVRLADSCVATGEEAAYADECVAPGKYRYGFALPYDCASSSCGTYYFGEATVTSALSAGCRGSAGAAAPTPVARVPWKNEREICGYAYDRTDPPPNEPRPAADASAVPPGDAALSVDAPTGEAATPTTDATASATDAATSSAADGALSSADAMAADVATSAADATADVATSAADATAGAADAAASAADAAASAADATAAVKDASAKPTTDPTSGAGQSTTPAPSEDGGCAIVGTPGAGVVLGLQGLALGLGLALLARRRTRR